MANNLRVLSAVLFALLLLPALGSGEVVPIDNGSVSGEWFNPNRDGEGFFIEVAEVNGMPVFVVAWFTHSNGSQLWLVGSAMIPAGATSITVDVQMPSGAEFGDAFDPAEVERTPWGTLTFSFESFNTGVVDYNSTLGFGSGSIDLVRLTKLVGIEQVDGASFTGRWEGLTSQGLPIALTVNDANRITLVEFDFQQLGEIPPDPNCQHAVSAEPSALISANGTFSVDVLVPPSTTILQFEGRLSGSLSDSQGMGQWDFSRTILFCQRTPTSSTTNGCGGEFPFFDSPCDDYDFSYDLSRME